MYILRYTQTDIYPQARGKFVGVDASSGGYPYPTDRYDQAHVFTTLTAVQEYQKHFEYLEICKLEVKITPINNPKPETVFVVVRPWDGYSAYCDGAFFKREDAHERIKDMKGNEEQNTEVARVWELEIE